MEQAALLFRMAEESAQDEVILDFTNVDSINTIFVGEYLARKETSGKIINEVNLSYWLCKKFDEGTPKPQAKAFSITD